MRKLILTWFLPFIIAATLVVSARLWIFPCHVIKNNAMSPNLVSGDVAFCVKKIPWKRHKVVLYASSSNDSLLLKRQIAIPGDTLLIKEGVILVNGQKVNGRFNAESRFSFQSDSIERVCKFLNDNKIVADYKKAHLGYFECKLSDDNAEKLKVAFEQSDFKRKSVEPKVRPFGRLFGHAFYWNYDNLGSLLVPKKGMKIKLGRRSFYLYRQIIEAETNGKPEIKGQDVFIEGAKLDIYTFKKDYVFLVNDNRSNYNDSRTIGFVAKEKIIGTYLFKLPW